MICVNNCFYLTYHHMTMTNQLITDLLSALELTKISHDTFLAPSFDFVGARVFGGQVLAQAMLAGAKTLEYDKPCHSFHGYFLRGGDIRYPVAYQVRRLRDGRSLSARQITAVQNIPSEFGEKEQVIFSMIASFSPMEGGLDYQPTMPDYPHADTLKDEQDLKQQYLSDIPTALHERYLKPRHIQIRPINPRHPLNPAPTDPHQAVWLKIAIESQPIAIHQALLAFASDYYLISTALMPHGLTYGTPNLQVASIDHAMHFHRPFDVSEWLLYDMWSDTASHAKGLNHGQFWQNGHLIATTAQEGLMRVVGAEH